MADSDIQETVASIARECGADVKWQLAGRKPMAMFSGRISYTQACVLNLKLHPLKEIVPDTSLLKFYEPETEGLGDGDAEIKEFSDSPELLKQKLDFLLDLIRSSKHFVVYTGAGISTACKIPDFRGPNGAWTRRDRGLAPPKCIGLAQAIPSKSHMALVALQKAGILKYLTSQNIDGLHRRSGVSPDLLSELHGNAFLEICPDCKKEFLRSYDTTDSVRSREHDPLSQSGISHITGRLCTACGGKLRDSIIHFTENLPELDLARGNKHAKKADLALTLGTSLQVSPACDLPFKAVTENDGKMVIVNLQHTPKDNRVLRTGGMLIHAKIDDVMTYIMDNLGIEIPQAKILTLDELLADYNNEEKDVFVPRARDSDRMEDVEQPGAKPKEIEIFIGNRHEEVNNGGHNGHRWTMFVAAKSRRVKLKDYIEEVIYHLHPTFNPNVQKSKAAPTYEISCLGWGTFEIGVEIRWKSKFGTESFRCAHQLNFKSRKTQNKFNVVINNVG